MSESRPRGWHPDPFGTHHERFYYEDDRPGRLVRDERMHESFDDAPGLFEGLDMPQRVARPLPSMPQGYAAATGAVPEQIAPPAMAGAAAAPVAYGTQPAAAVVQAPAQYPDTPDGWVDAPSTRWTRLHELKLGRLPRPSRPSRRTLIGIGAATLAVLLLVVAVVVSTSGGHGHSGSAAGTGATTLPTAPAATIPTAPPGPPTAGWDVAQYFGSTLGLNGVSCPTASVCIAVGLTTLVSGLVVTSVDGGTTWSQQHVPTGVGPLNDVSCLSALTCIAVGNGQVVGTIDGGVSWVPHPLGQGPITGIACGGAHTCVAVGTDTTTNTFCASGMAYTTTDSGKSWNATKLGCFTPSGISCPLASFCEVIGQQTSGGAQFGQVMGTVDAGLHWEVQYKLIGGVTNLGGISCPTANVCTVVGGSLKTPILGTSDGGKTWAAQASPPPPAALEAVGCANTQSCQAVASNYALTTANGGQTWGTQVPPQTVAQWSAVTCPSPSECIGVGVAGISAGVAARLST